jgi:hypothetical protein
MPPNHTRLRWIQAAVLGERIYIPGGQAQGAKVVDYLEIYDPRLDTWTMGAPLPAPLYGYALAALEGRLYLFGGMERQAYSRSVYIYDPELDTWRRGSDLPEEMAMGAAVPLGAGKILLAGGINAGGGLDRVWIYYPQRDLNHETAWEERAPLPEERVGLSMTTLAGAVYLVGGGRPDLPPLQYNPQRDTWQPFETAATTGGVLAGPNQNNTNGLLKQTALFAMLTVNDPVSRMKERIMKRVAFLSILIVLLTTLVLPGSNPVEAQSAPTWNSVIAYFNPNPGPPSPPEEMNVVLYKTDGRQIYLDFGDSMSGAIPMLPFQSGTLLLGEVVSDASFQGSAMVSATVPIMAVYKKVANNNEPYSPILYTSFDIGHAGQGDLFIPSVRRQVAYDTQIGIQNVESLKIDLEISVYDLEGTEILTITPGVTDPLNAYIFKMSSYPDQIPMPFEGSLVVRARLTETTVAARIVAAVQEIQAGGRRAFAYEGLTGSDTVILMPTAACQAGETALSTTYTVQNTLARFRRRCTSTIMSAAGDMLGNSARSASRPTPAIPSTPAARMCSSSPRARICRRLSCQKIRRSRRLANWKAAMA